MKVNTDSAEGEDLAWKHEYFEFLLHRTTVARLGRSAGIAEYGRPARYGERAPDQRGGGGGTRPPRASTTRGPVPRPDGREAA